MHQEPGTAGPALKKIDLTIARLRLLLADVSAREQQLADQRKLCREQHHKLVSFSLYGDSSLDTVLTMLADVQERQVGIEQRAQSLAAIRARAETELESLQLTKKIEEARGLLRQLQERQADPQPDLTADPLTPAEIEAEINRLQTLINQASERAAQTIERHRT